MNYEIENARNFFCTNKRDCISKFYPNKIYISINIFECNHLTEDEEKTKHKQKHFV